MANRCRDIVQPEYKFLRYIQNRLASTSEAYCLSCLLIHAGYLIIYDEFR
jgi:hypothetical protein